MQVEQSAAATMIKTEEIRREPLWGWAGLAAIVILAAVLRFANLDATGYANHYYTAAITSMLQSWHNFFFAAAEPGGAVSVDKPPLGLWIQALLAYFLGVSGFSVVLPQILAGILSVIVLYHLVRRRFGTTAGLLAALLLAMTPVVVATDRNNTMDSTLILTLLLAAWAFIRATESSKLRYLLLGAFLVGLGFNIKMLEAYLPLPTFYALYFLGSSETVRRKIRNLALATVLLVVVSFSWAVTVDLIPASERPFVGSSTDNSETSLIFGYNGVDRLLGMFSRGRPSGNRMAAPNPGNRPASGNRETSSEEGMPGPGFNPPAGFTPPGDGNMSYGIAPTRPQPGGMVPGNPPPGMAAGRQSRTGGGAGGGMDIGQAGPLRLFIQPLSKETSWLLPFGILGMLLLAVGTRVRWPLEGKHQALALWGGWLLTTGIFFSVAGFFHPYYLAMMAPALAALAGIGALELWKLKERHFRLSLLLLGLSGAGTAAFQAVVARSFTSNTWWLPPTFVVLAVGILLLIPSAVKLKDSSLTHLGFVLIIAAMLITPGIWSVLTNMHMSSNQSLPAAYSGGTSGPTNRGDLQINQMLLEYLQVNTQGMKYLMAVPSSMQGADYVIATGRPVLYMGGFNGQDVVVTANDLAEMVSDRELRYIYWGGSGGGPNGGSGEVSSWVSSTCKAVEGFNATTRNAGAPDGTNAGTSSLNGAQNTFAGGSMGIMRVALYDCAQP